MAETRKLTEQRTFWGFMVVGFLSLLGGIFMFIFVVPNRTETSEIPSELVMIFVGAYSKQNLLFNERKNYSPALIEVGIDQNTCRRYSCFLHLKPDGQDYELRLTQNGKTWFVRSKSPVPQELK